MTRARPVNVESGSGGDLSTLDRFESRSAPPFKGPFKGKGAGSADRRAYRSALEDVEEAMRQLKQRSIKRDLAVRPFYLDVIRRPTNGPPTITLRWRYTAGRHATWRTVQAAIVSLPRPIQAVYARLNGEAVKLNGRASALRQRLREIGRGEQRACGKAGA